MPRDLAANLPRTIRVTFPGKACGKATTAPDTWKADVPLADAAPANAGQGVDAAWGVSDTASAVFTDATPTPDPSNAAALRSLARLLAHDLWQWRTVGYDRAYAGVVAPDLGGLDDAVEWSYRADDCSTRLSTSTGDEPDRFNHADPAHDCVPGVSLYTSKPGVSVTGGSNSKTLTLSKIKLRVERGRLVAVADGTDSIALCGTSAGTGSDGAGTGNGADGDSGSDLVTQSGDPQTTQDGDNLTP